MPQSKPLKSGSFSSLNSRSWGSGGQSEDPILGDDDDDIVSDIDPGQVVASVDLTVADIDKAISKGFAPDREEDVEGDDLKARRAKPKGGESSADTDDDTLPYSKRVRKRIERERNATQRERQQRIDAQRENEELKERLAGIETRLSDDDKAAIDREIQGFSTELDTLETQLAKASEDGEHGEIAKLTRRMQETSAKKLEAERRKTSSQARKQVEGRDDDATRGARKMDSRAKDLMDANREWWDDKAHFEDRQIVLAVDQAVADAGFRPDTDEYYVELVSRLRTRGLGDLIRLPSWISEDDLEEENTPSNRHSRRQERRKTAARGPGGMGSGGRGTNDERALRNTAAGKVVLTRRDMDRMQAFRLDPNNPEHLRQFAASKQERAQQELQERG